MSILSIRQRPGKAYKAGDKITNRVVDSVAKNSKYLDKIHYVIIFNDCEHKGIVAHKTLTRSEISGKLGTCRECLRIAREKKMKPERKRISTWPPHPDRDIHYWAHRLLTSSIKEITA